MKLNQKTISRNEIAITNDKMYINSFVAADFNSVIDKFKFVLH